ncbi:MAG TPA: cytochrome c, partial [Vicinamibacterales bacterium]|nr:cytochrome c [Vicinamibacterales bacterium]
MRQATISALTILLLGSWTLTGRASDGVPGARADSDSAVTFAKDVAPILYARCIGCHRAGEVAPMSLVTYEDVRPWAKSIRRKVTGREMPPWGADPRFGTFKDDQSLSDTQIETIATWVDSGAPRGRDADLPPVPTFSAGWSHGEPDVVIEMPVDFEIPAEGEVPVTDFFTRSPFTHDVFVKALEVRPGTAGVVHHAGLYVIGRLPDGASLVNGRILDASGKAMSRNQVARANGGTSTEEIQKLLSFVPGRGYESYQGDAGQLIKAGSYIDFYMHYTPSGTPQ